jgi:hypothetical protein
MEKPKSKYLRGLLKKTRFEDRFKIGNLVFLESVIKRGERTREFEYYYNSPSYANAVVSIAKELNPKLHRELAREQHQEEKEFLHAKKQGARTESKERNNWSRLGGLP